MEESRKEGLPLFGVGPLYVIISLIITCIGIYLEKKGYFYKAELIYLKNIVIIIGGIFIIFGVILWIYTVIFQKIAKEIKKSRLVTKGAYAIVRNPIYSAITFVFSGILFMTSNLFLMLFPILFWVILSVLLKYTEERWLIDNFGEEYINYCKKVNRIIPWFPKK